MSKHTPGPWRLAAGDETQIYAYGLGIARALCGGLTGIKLAQAEANARLIAAAPDLLDALEWLAGSAEIESPEALSVINTAILQAKGTAA